MTVNRLTRDIPESLDEVSTTLRSFQGIRSRWLREVLGILPWILVFMAIAVLTVFPYLSYTDSLMQPEARVMFASGLVAGVIGLFLFQSLISSVPEILFSLWDQGIVSAPSEHRPPARSRYLWLWVVALLSLPLVVGLTALARGSIEVQLAPQLGIGLLALAVAAGYAIWYQVTQTAPAPVDVDDATEAASGETDPDRRRDEKSFVQFIHDFEQNLNSADQWASGLFFMALVFFWYPFGNADGLSTISLVLFYLIFALVLGVAFISGALAWRMIVVGVHVSQLGTRLTLTPRLGHPDRTGGLGPLGQLCLVNAFIVSVAGVFLGGWIVIGPVTPYDTVARDYYGVFSWLLIVPIVWAVVSFFIPLWSIHRVMAGQRAVVRRQQDQISRRIHELSDRYLLPGHETTHEEREEIYKEVASLQRVYDQYQRVPVWPFNLAILSELLSVLLVPVLGLSGIGTVIVEGIANILGYIWPST